MRRDMDMAIRDRGSFYARVDSRLAAGVRPSEGGIQYDLASHAYLVCRDTPLEEIRYLLDVLKVHEGEWILRSVAFRKTKRREPLVRAEFEVVANILDRETDDAGAEQVFRKLRLALDGLVEHLEDRAREIVVEEVRLLAPYRADNLERKRHVGAFVPEYPIGPRREPVKEPA
jgi:hypothetical protein